MSDDLISRQAAIDAVEKSMYENPHENAILRGMHDHEHRHFFDNFDDVAIRTARTAVDTCYGEIAGR